MASKTILGQPPHGRASQHRSALTFIDLLRVDVGLELVEFQTAMRDRGDWRQMVGVGRVRPNNRHEKEEEEYKA